VGCEWVDVDPVEMKWRGDGRYEGRVLVTRPLPLSSSSALCKSSSNNGHRASTFALSVRRWGGRPGCYRVVVRDACRRRCPEGGPLSLGLTAPSRGPEPPL